MKRFGATKHHHYIGPKEEPKVQPVKVEEKKEEKKVEPKKEEEKK